MKCQEPGNKIGNFKTCTTDYSDFVGRSRSVSYQSECLLHSQYQVTKSKVQYSLKTDNYSTEQEIAVFYDIRQSYGSSQINIILKNKRNKNKSVHFFVT
jgi:hypothetical protein